MTMAQQIEEIGIQKSMKKGIEEREKQASLKIVRHLLENGMESQSVR
ncbi:hypothetical protein [Candidatus Williamhamiltonella defendens]|nr:hypothetical protein [Candidatus Hamiltonella defensa]